MHVFVFLTLAVEILYVQNRSRPRTGVCMHVCIKPQLYVCMCMCVCEYKCVYVNGSLGNVSFMSFNAYVTVRSSVRQFDTFNPTKRDFFPTFLDKSKEEHFN